MYQHSEWFRLFTGFWWLIFPIAWMIGRGFNVWMRHKRAQQVLEMIKTYADQGKEPPAPLLEAFREPVVPPRRERNTGNEIFVAVLMAGIGIAFAVIAQLENDPHVYFLVVIMAAIALAFLARALMRLPQKDRPDQP